MVGRAAWSCAVSIARWSCECASRVESRTITQTITTGQSLNRVVKVNVRELLSHSAHFSADDFVACHWTIDSVGVAVVVGVDGAIDHAYDVEEEQETAEYVAALSVVFVQGSTLDVFEIGLLFFSFFLASHSSFLIIIANEITMINILYHRIN